MTDWRKPMVARAEELTQEIDGVADGRVRHAILWHLSEDAYERVIRMEACYHCLTSFPARPNKQNIWLWEEAEKQGWRHVRAKAVAHRLIREGRCPTCGYEISSAALEANDAGENPLLNRPDEA